ncbi:CsgG/HfaB family protein [Halanaerobacter jeridensis]|nr:CsgG/HfaB family protein [Halanaerobacter jeridensis]
MIGRILCKELTSIYWKEDNNMKNMIKISLTILIIILVTMGAFATEDNSREDSEKLLQKIVDSADEILSSKPNVTKVTQLLAALPEPESKAKIAVYNIVDKTGQVKDIGSSVVTQGATDMMITALQRSRQFIILDRVNFVNLMNEQNLKTKGRLRQGEGPQISRMTGSDYVLSGGVTEYQVDKATGGLGLKIAGVGGSNKYATASTAIDLRLTDTTTGEVVWAVSLKKEIKGEKIGIQTFAFIGNNVVEFETGKGKQEVINLVVRTLLEEAVFKLYQSGVF